MTLTLRNVPDFVHEMLKTQARANRRSLNQEALALFERVLVREKGGRAAEIARIMSETDEARSKMKRFMTDEEITAALEEGRA